MRRTASALRYGSSPTLLLPTSAAQRRQADLFWADWVGLPAFAREDSEAIITDRSMLGLVESSDDDVVRELDRIAGTHYGTFAGYRATLVDGTVFGCRVQGVHPDFLRKIQAAETAARFAIAAGAMAASAMSAAVSAAAAAVVGGAAGATAGSAAGATAATAAGGTAWGITRVGGFRSSRAWHNWGLAIDLDPDANPYVMHEACESGFDAQLAPIYHRISRFILQRDSVIPRDITQGSAGAGRTARLYQALAEESGAMITYFSFLRAPADLDARLRSRPLDAQAAAAFFGDGTAPTPTNVLRQIMRDYVVLKGAPGPAVPGETYPTPPALRAEPCGDGTRVPDRPFAGGSAARNPQNGFLTIRREIVVALSAQNLRWGGIDFGGASGDIMHFDDGNSAFARQIQSAKRAAG